MDIAHIRGIKCGSTTIDRFIRQSSAVLANRSGMVGNFLGHHSPYSHILEYLPLTFSRAEIGEMIWVSSVRDPISRAESAYAHLAQKRLYPDPDQWLVDRWLKIPTDEQILNGLDIPNLYVFKLENLSEDLEKFAQLINLENYQIPRPQNTRSRREYRRGKLEFEFSETSKDLIRTRHRWTLENFYS